jgi:Protein of unknown function (DUF3606)
MSDDKTKGGSQDRNRIDVNEKYEVQHWAKKFGVSEEELRAAVQRVGPTAAAVERDLKRKAA